MTHDSSQSNGRVPRRTVLKGLAVGTVGAIGTLSTSARGESRRKEQDDSNEQADTPTFEFLETTNDINEDFEYTPQTEFNVGDDVYVVAGVNNVEREGEVRFADHVYVLGGAGVITTASDVTLTNISNKENGWWFWYRFSTEDSDAEYADWVSGEYSAVVTVTDFITNFSVTEEAAFRLG